MKRILITGGAGLIGSWLVRHILNETDWPVVVLDRLDPAASLRRLADCFEQHGDRVALVHYDLRAEITDNTARELMTGGGKFPFEPFDYVAHLAASSHVDRANIQPLVAIADNVSGTAHLLEFVRQYAALKQGGKILHVSTDETMGPAPEGVAFKPEDRQRPRNVYAASKAGAEALVFAYAETFGLPLVMTRCTNVIAPIAHPRDPGQDAEKFIPLLIGRLLAEQPIQIHTVNGKVCSRFYVHVRNVTSAMLCVLENGPTMDDSDTRGVFHISGDRELDNIDVATIAARALGTSLTYDLVEKPPGRLKPDLRYCLDDSSLRALGWTPQISCEEGLLEVIESYRKRVGT